jgi:hypothetical protein
MSLTIINNTRTKPNLAHDMVAACIKHYQAFKRPIDEIVLSPRMWSMWRDAVLDKKPELEPDLDHFNKMEMRVMYGKAGSELVIRKGSELQVENMYITLKDRVIK